MVEHVACIYEYICVPTGKGLIGSTVSAHNRSGHHRNNANGQRHANQHFQHAWNKYGENSFEFRILEIVHIAGLDRTAANRLLTDREQWHIDNSPHQLFNISRSTNRPNVPWTPERKRKLSESLKRRPPFSEEWRQRIGNAGRGRKTSQEQRLKLSERLKAYNAAHPRSESHRAKIGNAKRGSRHTAQSIEKMRNASLAQQARILEENTREYMKAPKVCPTCDKVLSYRKRMHTFCSMTCRDQYDKIGSLEQLAVVGKECGLILQDNTYRGSNDTYQWKCAECEYVVKRTIHNIRVSKEKGVSPCSVCSNLEINRANTLRATGERARAAARQTLRDNADNHALSCLAIISVLRVEGIRSQNDLAKELNEANIPTYRGGAWHHGTVGNILTRLKTLGF